MPKLKQPSLLQNTSMDVLVGFLANCCDQLNSDDCLVRLRQVVASIKKGKYFPESCNLSAEFYKKFFEEFENLNILRMDERPDIHQRAALEIIMDRRIVGLRCEGAIMGYLNPDDAHRFDGLRVLDLSFYCYPLPLSLENFHFQDLTTFIFIDNCTDANLQVLGQNCPKLEFLDITGSEEVTNRGLSSLNLCSELRYVYIAFCRISNAGITQFLSRHSMIEKLCAWSNSGGYGFDCFSNPDPTVYPSIRKFTIVLDRVSDDHLRSVVMKFPNLESLQISGFLAGDLTTLGSLGKLSKLDFNDTTGFSWDNLKKLLELTGNRITDLRTQCPSGSTSCVTRDDLNFLYEHCGNIEKLKIHYRAISVAQKLVIPQFRKLKELSCGIPREYRRRKATLEFGKMLKLEAILIDRFHMTARNIESMILDHDKFPELKIIRISEISGDFDAGVDYITRCAKNHNLDFEIVGF